MEGFQKLLENGLRRCARKIEENKGVKPFEYVEADVPFYAPNRRGGGTGEPIHQMQKPLAPEESMKHMHLPEGFEVQLFASEPDIYKPICMAWDARGRLWIAETLDYPNKRQPAGKGHDRIVILEDTKGTGKADKFTVFADHLSIPTSMTFSHGGVIVTQAPDTLFLKDTDGDDKADVRQTLFSGWGTHDTHAGPSNLRYGFDNWIWGTVGYSGFNGTIGGKSAKFTQGIYRMKPDGSQLEYLTTTSNNTWGLGFSESGEVFASTANNEHSVFLGIPNRYFEAVRGWHGAAARALKITRNSIPSQTRSARWIGTAAIRRRAARPCIRPVVSRRNTGTEPLSSASRRGIWSTSIGLTLKGAVLSQKTAGISWRATMNGRRRYAPEVGPDGALWVIDWYSFIVQHNPTPKGFATGKGGAM